MDNILARSDVEARNQRAQRREAAAATAAGATASAAAGATASAAAGDLFFDHILERLIDVGYSADIAPLANASKVVRNGPHYASGELVEQYDVLSRAIRDDSEWVRVHHFAAAALGHEDVVELFEERGAAQLTCDIGLAGVCTEEPRVFCPHCKEVCACSECAEDDFRPNTPFWTCACGEIACFNCGLQGDEGAQFFLCMREPHGVCESMACWDCGLRGRRGDGDEDEGTLPYGLCQWCGKMRCPKCVDDWTLCEACGTFACGDCSEIDGGDELCQSCSNKRRAARLRAVKPATVGSKKRFD